VSDDHEAGPEIEPDPRQPPPGYKVGPKKPPYETRWGRGEPSPNPRGRPPKKHLKSFFDELDPLAAQVIEFDQKGTGFTDADGNEHTRATSYLKAVHLQCTQNARFAELYDRIRTAAYAEKKKLTEAAFEAALYHRWRYLHDFMRAEEAGLPVPDVLPDPRDVILRGNGEFKIVGPIDHEGREMMNAAVKMRDAALEGLELIEDGEADVDAVLAARNYLRRYIYRLHRFIPPRLRKRIPPLRNEQRAGGG
jgi:hypothetical protein